MGEFESGKQSAHGAIPPTLTLPRQGGGEKRVWPKTLPEQAQALRAALTAAGGPATAETLARTFQRARTDKVAELLATLVALGQAREVGEGKYVS